VIESAGGRIFECSAFGNGHSGLDVQSGAYVLLQNAAGGNVSNSYNIAQGLGISVGPEVDATTVATDTHPAANYK
jgi:hypothetical protein